jgi:hypothetical protein
MRGERGYWMDTFSGLEIAPGFSGLFFDRFGTATTKYRGLSAAAAKAPPPVEMTSITLGFSPGI